MPDKMKVLSVAFGHTWSWGLVENALISELNKYGIEFERVIMKANEDIPADVILCQQATLLTNLHRKRQTVCRLGGNRTFKANDAVIFYLGQMKQCHSIIATNRFLYNIGKLVNENTFLIPNGLDLDLWTPRRTPKDWTGFRVGFCGNVMIPEYREYKGLDFVESACKTLGFELVGTYYGEKQIPHDRMKEDFYHKIDCLVHPTLGEGCSNTIMEALACGCPVITTRAAGLHGEELQQFHNIMICERTKISVTNMIALLSESHELQKKLAVHGRVYAEARHDIRDIANRYRTVLEKCHKDNQEGEE